MNYPGTDMEIEPFDHVEFKTGGTWGKGQVISIHPRKGTVRVRYETGEVYRTSGFPKLATAHFSPADLILLRRDG